LPGFAGFLPSLPHGGHWAMGFVASAEKSGGDRRTLSMHKSERLQINGGYTNQTWIADATEHGWPVEHETNTERKTQMNILPIKTKDALVKQFNERHFEFLVAARASEPLLVEQINKAVELGVILKELLGVEAVTKSRLADWLAANPGRLCEQHIEWLMNYVAVSAKIEQVKTFAEVPRNVSQMVLQCAGILPEDTGREMEQRSHALPPCTVAWKLRMHIVKHFDSLLTEMDAFDEDQRRTVKAEIGKARAYLESLEAKL
jgi:hypothetical protein